MGSITTSKENRRRATAAEQIGFYHEGKISFKNFTGSFVEPFNFLG